MVRLHSKELFNWLEFGFAIFTLFNSKGDTDLGFMVLRENGGVLVREESYSDGRVLLFLNNIPSEGWLLTILVSLMLKSGSSMKRQHSSNML